MSTSEFPLVSIVIPVYNGSNYVAEAIDSALNQTYPNIEVVVVNDGSTDNGETETLVLSYGNKVRYFHKENGGVSTALNYGIKVMKGEYFAWLSHDDKHLPTKVEKQMEAIKSRGSEKPEICVCNFILIDGLGNELARSPMDLESYFNLSPYCFLGSETGFMIDGDATLINKKLFDQIGGFSEALFASQETDMWFRSLDVAEFIFMPDYLVEYRSHAQQVTHKKAELVGIEAGLYRGNITKMASFEDIIRYYRTPEDAYRFGITLYAYMVLNFYCAAHEMNVKLRQLISNDWLHIKHLLSGLFDTLSLDNIYHVLKEHVQSESSKKKILVYVDQSVEDLLSNSLLDFTSNLASEYDFYFVYCSDNTDISNSDRVIRFSPSVKYKMAGYLAVLADLLETQLLWTNASFFQMEAAAFSYLAQSDVRTVASFHYNEPSQSNFGGDLSSEDWHTNLSKASILTHEAHDLMITKFIYPYDSVILPLVSSNVDSCTNWSQTFKSVLASDYKNQLICENHPPILKSDGSKPSEEVMQNIKELLERFEFNTLEKHRQYYEESLYWRISKPLRMIADVFRKIV